MRDWQKELDDYIRKVLALGYSQAEIEAALRFAGWSDLLIAAGMRRVKEKAAAKQLAGAPAPARALLPAHAPELLLAAPRFLPFVGTAEAVRPAVSSNIWRAVLFTVEKAFDAAEAAYSVLFRAVLFPFVFASVAGKGVWHVMMNAHYEAVPPLTKKEIEAERFPEHVLVRDIIKLAGRMFRARRLRTFLTILGMSVGIGTILFLVSFGYGIQNVLFERITTAEALLTLDAFPPSDNALIAADDAMAERIRRMPHVKKVSTLALASMEMSARDLAAAGSLYVVDADYLHLAGARPLAGAVFTTGEARETVISSASLKLLNFQTSEEALGREVTFSISFPLDKESGETASFSLERPYTIVGVLDDPFSVFAYVPASALAGKATLSYAQFKVRVDSSEFLDPVRDQVLAEGLLVSALSETVSQAKKIFNIITVILALFGIITLVVSAIGMLNTMTIALLERTQEVGIMKAVGASNLDIWKLFLAEAMIMGFLGGVGGIVMGYVTANVFNYGINVLAKAFGGQALDLFQSPLWFVATIILFSAAVGMVTGLWPARRASRLDPLEALKYR